MKPTNSAATRPDHDDERLRTRHLRLPLAHVAAAVKVALPALRTYGRRWRLVEMKAEPDSVVLRAEVPVLVFTDDLVATLRAAPDGCRLNIASASRIGQGDFGENRRHILQLLSALQSQLGSALSESSHDSTK
jgi:hypothetical protein